MDKKGLIFDIQSFSVRWTGVQDERVFCRMPSDVQMVRESGELEEKKTHHVCRERMQIRQGLRGMQECVSPRRPYIRRERKAEGEFCGL